MEICKKLIDVNFYYNAQKFLLCKVYIPILYIFVGIAKGKYMQWNISKISKSALQWA